MKRMSKITTLLLALMTVLMMSQAAFAVSGGTFTYNGSDIKNSKADSSIDEQIANLQPGDSVTFTFTYENKGDAETSWYLENKVVKTLEEDGAENGGYSYKLINYGVKEGTVTIFDSDAVAGEDSENPDSDDEGLKAATNATEDWLYIDTLQPGESGRTELTVALDGESQANSYESTSGQLRIAYGVEETPEAPPKDKIKYRYVNTGDTTNIILPAAVFLGSLILFALAVKSFRKDRKDGDEA